MSSPAGIASRLQVERKVKKVMEDFLSMHTGQVLLELLGSLDTLK